MRWSGACTMAFIVYSVRGHELGRQPLDGPVLIGRAQDCDVRIRDIRLSRHHCRIEPTRSGGWTVIDLQSRNGTHVDGRKVTRHGLHDGDALLIGNAIVRFHIGRMTPVAARPASPRGDARPLDPHEALAGTVTDFVFDAEFAELFRQENNLPTPRPVPPDPECYAREDVYGMLTEIASSSWDSIYAGASRPLPGSDASATATAMQLARPRARADRFDSSLEARPVRPKRPALPAPSRPASRMSSALRVVARPLAALHRWVAPPGKIRLF
jgi:predicted component of type VI protein secretion system